MANRDIEFVRPLWSISWQKARNFMVKYRDPRTGLRCELRFVGRRWGVHSVHRRHRYGGLKAARKLCHLLGDQERAEIYNTAAEEIKAGAAKYLFSHKLNRFVRRLVPGSAHAADGWRV